MTDTSTLRLLLRESCDLLDEVRSHETENFIARVKIALDAQTEQPTDLQLSVPKVGSAPQDQTAVSPAPDAVAEAAIGPRSAFPTCKGCPAFMEEWWREPSGDGETYDSGRSQDCKAAERSIATYGSPIPRTPEWCPALAKGPQP